jgi:hypothetical protein
LQTIEEGHELKQIAEQILALLDGADAPAEKIEKIKVLLPSQADAASEDESAEGDNDEGENTK